MNPPLADGAPFPSHPTPPPRGLLRPAYLLFLVGTGIGLTGQVAFGVLWVLSLYSPASDSRLPGGIFGLGLPVSAALVVGCWLLHRLRVVCPWADRALSAPTKPSRTSRP